MRKITKQEIDKAITKSAWDLGNKVLYKLCSEHPLHKTDQEIIAKIWLIGRSYAAAIERHKSKSSDSKGDKFYERKVAPKIRCSKIDKWFTQLKREPKAENAVELHSKLTGLFYEISELELPPKGWTRGGEPEKEKPPCPRIRRRPTMMSSRNRPCSC